MKPRTNAQIAAKPLWPIEKSAVRICKGIINRTPFEEGIFSSDGTRTFVTSALLMEWSGNHIILHNALPDKPIWGTPEAMRYLTTCRLIREFFVPLNERGEEATFTNLDSGNPDSKLFLKPGGRDER